MTQAEVIVLDAYAVRALLKGEQAAAEVQALLERDDNAVLTVLGVAEVVDHLVRLAGVDDEDAALDVAQLGLDEPDPIHAGLGLRPGLLRSRHYHRRARAVGLADCVLAETARSFGASVASSDPYLLDVCGDEGIAVLALPGSDGTTWSP